MMNFNDLAVKVARRERGKIQVSIAQIKEIQGIVIDELGKLSDKEMIREVRRYCRQRERGR
jgi:hypothetical protein